MPFLTSLAFVIALALPGVQPQLAASGDLVFLAFGQGDEIHVARSTDKGQTFGVPVRLPTGGRMALGMRRGPRIAVTEEALLITAVVGDKGGGADGDVVLFRSTDQGTTWSAASAINDVPAAAREGLHAMAATPDGLVVVAWLDLREKGTRLFTAVSRDHGVSWTPDRLAYASPSGSVCECCHPSVAIGPDGRIAIMFRNNLDGHRDMYVTESADGVSFTAAARLGTGTWLLNACPMDGGAITLGPDGVVSVWRREGTVLLSTPTVPERALGTGRDPVVARAGSGQDIAWSAADGVRLVRGSQPPLTLGRGRFPSLVALRDSTVIAWEHDGQVMIRALPR